MNIGNSKIQVLRQSHDTTTQPLKPLFTTNAEYEEFKTRHEKDKVEKKPLAEHKGDCFVVRILNRNFKSHDLGSAAQLMRKETDSLRKSDVLDRVNIEAITKRLMELLDIRNQEKDDHLE